MLENIKISWEEKKPLWIVGIVIFVILSIIVLVMIFNKPKPKVISAIPISLTWWQGGDVSSEVMTKVTERFKATSGNGSVTINIVPKKIDSNYYNDLISTNAKDQANLAPDIFTLKDDDLAAYQDYLAPIDNIRDSDLVNYEQNFVRMVSDYTKIKDKVFGVTSYVDNLQLYYNKNILNQSLIPRPASSWEELSNQSQVGSITRKALNNQGFLTSTIALGTGGRGPEGPPNIENHSDIIPLLIFQQGASISDRQTSQSSLGNERNAVYNALRFYLDFADQKSSNYTWNTSSPSDVEAFAQGKLAYIINYKSFSKKIKKINPKLDFDVTRIPQLNPKSPKTFGKFYMDSLNKKLQRDAENPNSRDGKYKYLKAQEFLQYITSLKTQEFIADAASLPSAHLDVIKKQLTADQETRIFAEGAINATTYYKPDANASEKVWSDIFERIQYRNKTLDESLSEGINDYGRILTTPPKIRK